MRVQGIKKSTLLLLVAYFLVGCSSAEKEKASYEYSKDFNTKGLSSQKTSIVNYCPNTPSKWKNESLDTLINYANGCAVRERWSQLEKLGLYLIEKEGTSPWGPYYLSLVAEKENKVRRALWMIDLSLKKSPRGGLFYYHKARLLWKEEAFGAALEAMKLAVAYDNHLTQAHIFLGQIYLRDQKYSEAQDHFLKAVAQKPSNYDAQLGLGESYYYSRAFEKAAFHYEKALDQMPSQVGVRAKLAEVYEQNISEKREALKTYKRIKSMYRTSEIEKVISFNLNEKIKALEVEVAKLENVERNVSSAEGDQKNQGVKK